MCIACLEFIKNTLTLKEYKSALWEVARENEEHLTELERLFKASGNDAEKLRDSLSQKLKSPRK
jgi:hypothetical protein